MQIGRRLRSIKSVARKCMAFTLVELLVVIGIIALLVSILLPALNGARQEALSVECLSNLRQCGQYLYIYANQNGGYFPQMYLSVTAEFPRNKGSVNTTHNGVTFQYPDIKAALARIANPGSDPYLYLTNGKPFSPGGLKVFYCPAYWFPDPSTAFSYNPEDFMKAGGTGDGGKTGLISYWYFGDPDPYYPQYHYSAGFDATTGEPNTLGQNGTLDSYFYDTNHNGDNRDEYIVRLGEKNMDKKALLTDQSRQVGSGNEGSKVGFQFAHGSQTDPLRKGWTNVLYGDGHAASKKPNILNFLPSGQWNPNAKPTPDEIQPRWENAKGNPPAMEMW